MIRGTLLVTAASMACLPARSAPSGPGGAPVDTVYLNRPSAADSALQESVARLQLQLYERDAQIADLQRKLDQAIDEVVRSMARLQSLASRAEAASAIAEAEIAVTALTGFPGSTDAPERAQANGLLRMSTEQFEEGNYGGAVYLATEARTAARRGSSRLESADRSGELGETLFTVPIRMRTTARSNVRGGPGMSFGVRFTLDEGEDLTGHGFVDTWVRVTDQQGRTGWIYHSLVTGAGKP